MIIKVKEIEKTDGTVIRFDYDAMGNRIAKHEIAVSGTKSTFYVLDAQGNVMGVYDNHVSENNLYLSEHNIYGSSRLGQEQPDFQMTGANYTYTGLRHNDVGDKRYELSNHLGNVLNVVTDRKLPINDGFGNVDYYTADVVLAQDFYPFGMTMPGRHANEQEYRYGAANGQEKVDEISGSGNHYTGQYWEYDPRTGRRWNTDPVVKHHESPYACYANNPIWFMDPNGADTSNYVNSINKAGYKAATIELNKSIDFKSFFQSFVDGANKDIKLEFKASEEVLDAYSKPEDPKIPMAGQCLLLFQGNLVTDISKVPKTAKMSDFSIQINLMINRSSEDANRVENGVTLAHEMFVHALEASSYFSQSVDDNGNFDPKKLSSLYLQSVESDSDHKALGANQKPAFKKVIDQVIDAQITGSYTNFRPALSLAERLIAEKQLGTGERIRDDNSYTWKQLWKNTYNENLKSTGK